MLPLNRKPDWLAQLTEYIANVRTRPFVYGENDCMLFPAGAINAMTGTDIARSYRGRYDSLTAGRLLLQNNGYKDQYDFIRQNFEEIPTALARVGDAALLKVNGELIGGVVQGEAVYALLQDGLAPFARDVAKRTYKVG